MHPISEILCEIYNNLLDRKEVFFLLTETQKRNLDSVVKTVNSSFFGVTRFPTPEEKAAAYFVLIIKDHPVIDGNKRLAVILLKIYTEVQKLKIDLPEGVTLDNLLLL